MREWDSVEVLRQMESGAITSYRYTEWLIEQMALNAEQHNAFIHIDRDRALELAAEADTRRRMLKSEKEEVPPLLGLPLVVKDNIETSEENWPTTAGSPAFLKNFSQSNAAIVEQLEMAGAFVMAKTNLHEFALGVTSNNKHFGAVRNPHLVTHNAGGSSGGTGTAVAAGYVPAGLGTDTGGSVRIPASHTGIVGFRPSTGRYLGRGVVPLSATLDTVGTMARSVRDIQLLDGIVARNRSTPSKPSDRVRLGVDRKTCLPEVNGVVTELAQSALDRLSQFGIDIVEVDFASANETARRIVSYIIFYEPKVDLPRYLEEKKLGFDFESLVDKIASPDIRGSMQWIIDDVISNREVYEKALRDRMEIRDHLSEIFETHDLDALFCPTSPLPSVAIDLSSVEWEGKDTPLAVLYTAYTSLPSAIGFPAISLPLGKTAEGLPVGLQLMGHRQKDAALLEVAARVESILR